MTGAYYIKLNNGNEIISEILADNNDQYILSNPLAVEDVTDENGNMVILLVRLAPFLDPDNPVPIPKNQVLICQKASDVLQSYYGVSLDLCRTNFDKGFNKGITDCLKQMTYMNKGDSGIESDSISNSNTTKRYLH